MKTIRVGLIVAPRKFDDLKTSIFDLQASLLLVSKKKIHEQALSIQAFSADGHYRLIVSLRR